MRTFTFILLLSTFISAQSNSTDSRGFLVKIGDNAPDFEMTFIDGNSARLSDYLGTPVMLQFTASWCSVCRREMPHIEEEIWNRFRDRGLIVIGVDRDEPLEKVKQFVVEMKTTYPMTLDPGADIFGLYAEKESGVTRNVLIDRNGKIVFLTRLFEKDEFNSLIQNIVELTTFSDN